MSMHNRIMQVLNGRAAMGAGSGGIMAGKAKKAKPKKKEPKKDPKRGFDALTVVELKEKLRAKGLPVSGKKADLVNRLRCGKVAKRSEAPKKPLPKKPLPKKPSKGGIRAGGNSWIQYVKDFARMNNVSYGDALKMAGPSYRAQAR